MKTYDAGDAKQVTVPKNDDGQAFEELLEAAREALPIIDLVGRTGDRAAKLLAIKLRAAMAMAAEGEK